MTEIQKYGLVLDVFRKPNTLIGDANTISRVDNLRGRLIMFDSLVVLKEMIPESVYFQKPEFIGNNFSTKTTPFDRGMWGRRLVHYPVDADQSFLVHKKIAQAIATPSNFDISSSMLNAQDRFMRGSDNRSNEWPENYITPHKLFLPRNSFSEDDEPVPCLTLDLFDGLPSPSKDVPLDDVLEFKLKRDDERIAFLSTLDEISNDIEWMASNARNKELETRIKKHLTEFAQVNAESWGVRVRQSIKFEYILDKTVISAFSGFLALQQYFGSSPAYFAIPALSGLKVSINLLPTKRKPSEKAQAISYLDKVVKLR